MCHHRTTENKRLYEDERAHEDPPEWAQMDETDEEAEAEDAEKPNPFAPAD